MSKDRRREILDFYGYPKRPCDTLCLDGCPAKLDCPLYKAWEKEIKADETKNLTL